MTPTPTAASFGGGPQYASPGFPPPSGAQAGGYSIYNQGNFPGGAFGSASSQYSGSTYASRAPSSWGMHHSGGHSGGQFSVSGGKENFLNAPTPSVRSQKFSVDEDASSLGMNSLSMKESNGPKTTVKIKNPETNMHYPDVYQDTMMNKHAMDQHVAKAGENPIYANQKSSELLTRVHNHEGVTNAADMFDEQLGIYDEEETRCQAGIDNVKCMRKDSDTAHNTNMANLADAEANEIRKIKAEYDAKRALKKNDNDRKNRAFDVEIKGWEEKKEENKVEKVDNLTLAKAKKLSFELGIEIFSSLAQLEARQGDQEFINHIHTCVTLLNQYRQCLSRIRDYPSDAGDAMETLKTLVWEDYAQL